MFRYEAPNPYPVKTSWFGSLFSSSTSSLSSPSLGKLILPAQQYRILDEEKLESKEVDVSRGEIQTHDGATLRTVILTPHAEAKKEEHGKKYIIKFNGNGGLYQYRMQEFADEAEKLSVSVVGFNYRNVSGSTIEPKEFQDLVTDGIAEVQRLLDQGVASENILLDGHSLGGAVATKTAEHFHKTRKPLYLINDRSFATLPKAAAGIISSESIETSSAFSLAGVMAPAGWGCDAASAYEMIPPKYKLYLTVVPEKEKSVGDGVISSKSSLHSTVAPHEAKKTGYLFYSGKHAGHNMPRAGLFSKDDPRITAQQVCENFVNRAFKKS